MTPLWNKLLAELRAIDIWDNDFYRERVHRKGTIIAFETRQSRRRQILEQLSREKVENNVQSHESRACL
jgi:hypothetical protein